VSKPEKEIKPPCFVELAGIKDLARLACAIERAPLPVFAIESEKEIILSVQFDLFMGRPIFYYTKNKERKAHLGYRNLSGIEEALLTDSANNPTFIYAPVIAIKKLPAMFEKALNSPQEVKDKFLTMEVSDLPSLAKISSYKMIFEEPPIPLYAFETNKKWIAGAFARIDDDEEASLFFFVRLDAPPESFLKYSMQKTDGTSFTSKIEEHGYAFIKVIKLASKHPLVDL
jgi:hypothetical protein